MKKHQVARLSAREAGESTREKSRGTSAPSQGELARLRIERNRAARHERCATAKFIFLQ